jgi:hypothetical protein
MKDEDLLKSLNEILKDGEVGVKAVNIHYQPEQHLYTITEKHIAYNERVTLGDEEIKRMEQKHGPMCGFPKCTLKYEEHINKRILLLQLTRTMEGTVMNEIMHSIMELSEKNKVIGFGFVDTPEKYRVI